MKKLIILSAIILSGLGFSTIVYGQNDLFINNTTGCSYTVDIYWTNGSIPIATCDTFYAVNINA